jgi:hypothetical protein
MKIYKFGEIDWVGFKSVLIHILVGALVAAFIKILEYISGLDFGVWGNMLIMPAITGVTSFLKKLGETYSVVIPNTPVTPNADTGAVIPDTTLTE